MVQSIKVSNRLIPLEHIALIEPFDPTAQHQLNSKREFQSRILLIDRDSVLSEHARDALAEANRFRTLKEDGVALNPGIRFSVEAFVPNEGFNPTKAYKSRLTWKDQDGEQQSKLLLTGPEDVLEIVMSHEDDTPSRERIGRFPPRKRFREPEGPK